MSFWLRIDGRPPRQYYQDDRALPHLVAGMARHQLLRGVSPLQSNLAGELPNMSVTLDNRSDQCTELLRSPPLGAAATVGRGDVVEFAGTVQSVTLAGGECRLELEA